jgi:prohibitin 2
LNQGEAEAAKLIANAVANNPGFVELREIQYAKEVAETIANSNFKVYLNSDVLLMSGLARNINAPKAAAKKFGIL